MSAQPERGRGELLEARRLTVDEPCDLAMRQSVVEQRSELQARDCRGGEAGDEFAAHAMPRVAAGLVDRDRHALALECEPQRESRESAADDFDGLRGIHGRGRRTATIR